MPAGRASTAERGRHIGYLEAHIEQGETLESGGLKIGVVTSIVGIWQYRITFTGEQNHAGTTRMAVRRDAGLALARFCVEIDDRFPAACGPRTVWTTGRITLDPGAPSIIPGARKCCSRSATTIPRVIARLEDLLRSMAAEVSAQGRCSVAVERIRTGAPAMMDAAFQQAIEAASAAFAGGRSIRMPSGAGHDAQVLATIMPAGMLFVPSIGGISHHWTENTADADIVTGAEVFVDACRRLLADGAMTGSHAVAEDTKPAYSIRDIPAGVWALGFVSMLMDVSSEMIHALLPIYLVTVLGTSMVDGRHDRRHRRGDGRHHQDVLRRAVGLARQAQVAGGHRLRPGGPHQAGLSAGARRRLAGRGALRRSRSARASAARRATRWWRISRREHLRGASFGLRQSLDTVGAFIGPLLAIVLMC